MKTKPILKENYIPSWKMGKDYLAGVFKQSKQPVIEKDSPLWNRLLMPLEGRCVECKCWTENRDDDEWVCPECVEDAIRMQREDQRLDDPRRGQAKDLNR